MLEFHRRLARLGLDSVSDHGFVLAGGYALSVNGIGSRPSADVDLFTSQENVSQFHEAAAQLRQSFLDAGLNVETVTDQPGFLDVRITDPATGESSDLQMGVNFREFPPQQSDVGPVLNLHDAVPSKMSALWSRGETRDFIDIYNVIATATFTRDEVLTMGDSQEANPMDRDMLAARFNSIQTHTDTAFARYDVGADQRARIVNFFQTWAEDITPAADQPARDAALIEQAKQLGTTPDELRETIARATGNHPHNIPNPTQTTNNGPVPSQRRDTGTEHEHDRGREQ